ncbi:radiation-inducible immediate-early gene IEX-1 [Plectropomus leopardus]|uniref:radiation-inducible immediate-early gene IEX-1 n=1 Tax=Plectropomus leopardus TaxID=160734 RepID=UPI001C4BAF82|nr:radiation-inducible immediate-early gene IEX-1 [Plectropomus leopardus]
MYSRSDSVTMTVQRESFAFSRMATRSTEPEVFTFERIPAQATAVRSYVPIRPKKRCTRVMYPAKVRMHLPPPEKNQAKRWLIILCLVVLWQIYTEEPCAETPLSSADSAVADYQGFPFQSAEEEARQLAGLSPGSELLSAATSSCEDEHMIPNTCPKTGQDAESFEQSAAGKSMVALLVYHRLGSDN